MARNESDTAWKEILDTFFKDYIDYCLPELSKLIDWSQQCESLDKELQAIMKNTASGKHLVDKLFKVYLKDGSEQWILIHLEIQGRKEHDFPERMFIYGYKIYDKYRKPIVSCAILIDSNRGWRPYYYQIGFAGSYLRAEFLVVKLIDYLNKQLELEASTSPFACVILVQLAAIESKRKPALQRKQIKFALTKRLYHKGYSREYIIKLYQFIDWTIGLPKSLEIEYLNNVYELEDANKMTYVTSAERFGIEKGRKQALEEVKTRITSAERFGIEKGLQKGRQEGRQEERRTFAKFLLAEGHKDEYVAKATRLSLIEINELKETKLKIISAEG